MSAAITLSCVLSPQGRGKKAHSPHPISWCVFSIVTSHFLSFRPLKCQLRLSALLPALHLPPRPDTAPSVSLTRRPSGLSLQTLPIPDCTSLWSQTLFPSAAGL